MATATLVQENRPLQIVTPLGANAFTLARLEGTEALSQLFEVRADVLALSSTDVNFDALLGQPVTLSITLADDGGQRHLHGIVRQVSQGGALQGPDHETLVQYRLVVVPKVWLLGRSFRSRIFQQTSVPDILQKVLTGFDVEVRLQGTYEPRDYCTQYRESDLDFATRLMEEEGIYYFFKHTESAHTLVLADSAGSHPDLPSQSTLEYASQSDYRKNGVQSWEKRQEIRSGKYTLWDHNFELPRKNLEATKPILDSVAVGTVTHKLKVGGNDQLEIYEFPGGYAKRYDGVDPTGGDQASQIQKIFEDNARTADLRMQAEETASIAIAASSDCPQVVPGHKFTLSRHANANGSYLVTAVRHEAWLDQVARSGGDASLGYENTFACIPAALPFRPASTTPRPRIYGCQTATVVGPSGEEIFTDKYGRVKVQFHWDREGTNDAKSSCWLRVASSWAGKQWGAIHIPRIGQEVLVDFLDGDPDRPIVVGSVYNPEQMPPYALPDNRTQSGIKSRSTLKGTAENFNEIRFEDKKDSEQVYVHAEKDLDTVVENNETRKIGAEKKDKGDQTIEIFNNQTTRVGTGEGNADDGSQTIEVYKDQSVTLKTGDQSVTVEKGKQTITVEQDRAVTVRKGNDTLTVDTGNHKTQVKTGNHETDVDQGNLATNVKMGNHSTQVDMGNVSVTVKMGNHTTKVNLGKVEEEAMQSIELKVGQSSIKVDQMGVTIKGMMVKIEGQVQTEVKGLMTQVNGDAMLMVKGGITMIN